MKKIITEYDPIIELRKGNCYDEDKKSLGTIAE